MSETIHEDGYIKVKKCREGTFMYNKNDKYIGRSLDLYGEYVNGESEIFKKFLQPGMFVMDIGANIGVHTVTMAKLVGATGAVIAFEPQRVIHQMLGGNIQLNGLKNVDAKRMALGNEEGSIPVMELDPDKENNFGGLQLSKFSSRGEDIPLHSLDALGYDTIQGQIQFMKIDVEEMEQDVIEGARKTIAVSQPVMYVENNGGDKAESLLDCINSLDYACFWHRPMLFNKDNFFGVTEDIFPKIASYNMLSVPKAMKDAIKGLVEVTKENCKNPNRDVVPIK